jgi:5-methyltetrahydrofolate--homocysteine methyltransferase
MKDKSLIKNLLETRILILDGAMGTELAKRGLPPEACPMAWSVRHPDAVLAVHGEYLAAGADVVYTATLGGSPWKLAEYNETDTIGLNRELARLARQAAGAHGLAAGDIGPSGKFVEPFGELGFEEAVAGFKLQVQGLAEGGADLFVIETMFDIQEARAALIAVKETCPEAFTIVTVTVQPGGRTLGGTTAEAATVTLQSLGADAVGINCGGGPETMVSVIAALKPIATVPLVAKPNAGLPRLENGVTVFPMGPEEFAAFGPAFAEAGVNLVGGCCGSTPDHIRLLAQRLKNRAPAPPRHRHISALSSAREALVLRADDPVMIIGERINPTGKKALQEELRAGRFTLVEKMAIEQKAQGAALLDVNAGLPGADEAALLHRLTALLALKTDLPLVLDSADPAALARALRFYPGRALVNSLSGEKEKIEKLLPTAAFYGAMLVLLPVTGRSVPRTATERVAILETLIAAAAKYGLGREDLVADGLTMALSADPALTRETLATIGLARGQLGLKTVIGLSNVSFGLPERRLINAAFLAQAAAAGLSFAIANPGEPGLMEAKLAADLLRSSDPNAERWVRFCQGRASVPQEKAGGNEADPARMLEQAILDGADDALPGLVKRALAAGIKPLDLMEAHLISAITRAGELFAAKKYFLPQLVLSAGTMEKACRLLLPHMGKNTLGKKGKIILATVAGDIHDIGKNIVALLLRNYGFEVIDLGKDVSPQAIVEKARAVRPDAIGLSALMTTTMGKMKETIELARAEKIDVPFILGGAVVTEEYARSVGAHYAADGVEAAAVLERVIRK